ncbi:MAG: nucleoside permease [Daejeonella sp.]
MDISVRSRLSGLMFFQYFIWGAWYVTMGTYLFTALKADAIQIGSSYANLSIAAIISPFIVGLIADRFFSAQKVLGVLHLLGALTLYYVSTVSDFTSFWWLILVYTLLYMPTISLSNSISFSQMKDAGKEFPAVRVFGTLGWIVAGIMISYLDLESSVLTFRIAAACSLLLGIFSFFLPDTPAKNEKASIAGILGLDALVLFKNQSFNVFFITSILICIPLAFYYGFTNPFLNDIGLENAAGKMTLGQVSEVVFMLVLPLLYVRFGVKKVLLIGMAAWVARYLFFAFGDAGPGVWMLYGGIVLHGICYDFFFVTGQIYIDKKADAKVRSAAQGLITLATYGVGMLIGSFASGYLTEQYGSNINGVMKYDWQTIWMYPAGIAVAVIIIFSLLFKEKENKVRNSGL